MSRSRHPDKHIEKAVQYAEQLGWTFVPSKGHAWGRLFCPAGVRGACIISVWSTPRRPENHARHLRREVDNCQHQSPAEVAEEVEGVDEHETSDE